LVFKKKNKYVVLQPIEIMGTTNILDQSTTSVNLIDLIDKVFNSIMSIIMEFPILQLYLLSNLKVLRGKRQDLLARGIAGIEHPDFTSLFLVANGDNSLKRHKGLLESLTLKGNPIRDRAKKFIHI
jgi:hypothetical protein